MESAIRLIKKYPNRRLYDTGESCYIKLDAVKEMIEKNISVKVIDSQTEKDITRSILLQIILEQESNQEPLFSTENLENFIRYYGENSREGFMYFMGENLQYFQEQQEKMQENFKGIMNYNPLDFITDTTKKNLDSWQQMQEKFLNSTGFSASSKTTKED